MVQSDAEYMHFSRNVIRLLLYHFSAFSDVRKVSKAEPWGLGLGEILVLMFNFSVLFFYALYMYIFKLFPQFKKGEMRQRNFSIWIPFDFAKYSRLPSISFIHKWTQNFIDIFTYFSRYQCRTRKEAASHLAWLPAPARSTWEAWQTREGNRPVGFLQVGG